MSFLISNEQSGAEARTSAGRAADRPRRTRRRTAAAIALQRANGKGHATQQGIEERGGGEGGSAEVGLNHVPARDHIADGERFENYAGQGRTSRVSTYTRSPGCETAYCLGLRMAKGRERRARRLPGAPLRGASISRPCRLHWLTMRPTMEVETHSVCWPSRTASLSLPQRG